MEDLCLSRCSCAILTRQRPKRWKNSLRFWFSSSPHSIQLAFLLPDRAATKGGRQEDEPSEPRVRQQEIPSSADSAPALPPLLSPAVCYLNSSRPSGAASSDRDAVWNFDRITNEHRRGEERRAINARFSLSDHHLRIPSSPFNKFSRFETISIWN